MPTTATAARGPSRQLVVSELDRLYKHPYRASRRGPDEKPTFDGRARPGPLGRPRGVISVRPPTDNPPQTRWVTKGANAFQHPSSIPIGSADRRSHADERQAGCASCSTSIDACVEKRERLFQDLRRRVPRRTGRTKIRRTFRSAQPVGNGGLRSCQWSWQLRARQLLRSRRVHQDGRGWRRRTL